jgi:uncharacterized protein (AIM24 family)
MANTINADNGVSSGTAGLKSTSDGTGILALQTNGTTAVTVDASQNTTLAGTLTLGTATQAVPSGTAPLYAARAWVNFNGTGTVAIRSSGNVSSITDNGTGNYTVNFTTAMSDANYSVSGSGSAPATYVGGFVMFVDESTSPTTSAVKLKFHRPAVGDTDTLFCNVSIFR